MHAHDDADQDGEVSPVAELLANLPAPPLTIDDLDLLPDDGRRYEIIDGSLLVSPPALPRHQVGATQLLHALHAAAPDHFITLAGGAGIIRRPDRFLVPDVVVVSRASIDEPAKGFDARDVVVAVEVVSPSNPSNDLVLKRALYADLGIPHYWILDSRGEPQLDVLRLCGGRYEETTLRAAERISLVEPFGITLCPEELLTT
jgi:Uma2 family endonuclease